MPHASTFAPTGRAVAGESVTVGMTGPFEILSIDPAQKRIGVALIEEGPLRRLPPPRFALRRTGSETVPYSRRCIARSARDRSRRES